MFDLITGKTTHIPHTPAAAMLVSGAAQTAVVGLLLLVPLLYVTDQLPAPETMMAFVAAAPTPPPPPPPPPPAPERRTVPDRPVPTTGAAAPIEEPPRIEAESALDFEDEEGIPGGVAGGIPGGIVGGLVSGFDVPPPPPAPPPRGPVRIGGQIKTPELLRRIEPVYPPLAVAANIEGVVILDAVVDEEGRVTDVKVLRSGGVLDGAALEAVRQWRYAALLLNGRPVPFQLTVVLSFRLTR